MKRWLLSMAMALGTTMVLTPAQAGEPLSFFTEEWIPFNFATESGEVDGFTTAIVKRISQKLGTKVSIELQPWSRALKNAQSTKNSAIYSIYRNQEREKFFKWVGPLYQVETVLWGLKEKNLSIKTLEDAKKYTIAVQADSAYITALDKKGFDKKKVMAIYTTQEIEMVIRGVVDLVPLSILSIPKLNVRLKEQQTKVGVGDVHWRPYVTLFSDGLYLGFNIDTPDETISEWQKELDRLKASPFYKDLEKTHISPILNDANAYR